MSRVSASLLSVPILLLLAVPAHAQATRTWVSGVGDDANPCSRTAPCKTFAGAISKTSPGGFIDALDPGGFGTVTITKSITIDGGPGVAGVLTGGTSGIIVNAGNIIVHLRNLSIESPTLGTQGVSGILVLNGAELHVEHCVISGFSVDAIDYRPAGGGVAHITDTTIMNNEGGGIVVNTGRVTVDNLRAEGNGNGVVVNGTAIATVRNSYASGGGAGFGATVSAGAVINIEGSTATHNQYGIFAGSGATVRLGNSSVLSNTSTGLFNDGTSFIVSLQGNQVVGNPSAGGFTSTITRQ